MAKNRAGGRTRDVPRVRAATCAAMVIHGGGCGEVTIASKKGDVDSRLSDYRQLN